MHFLFPLEFSIIVSIFNFLQRCDFEKCMSLSKPCKNLTNHQCDMVNHMHDAKDAKTSDIHLILINWGFNKSLLKKNTSALLESCSNELYLRKMQLDVSGAFGMKGVQDYLHK